MQGDRHRGRRGEASGWVLGSLALVVAVGGTSCREGRQETTVFGSGGGSTAPGTGAEGSTSSGGTGGANTGSSASGTLTTGATGASGTTGSTSESSVGGSSTLVLDVGVDKDVGDDTPAGCKGKIDFLFVISRDGVMVDLQAKMVAAFPKFIETIESKFADFDFHIMVVDGDAHWGHTPCNEECTPDGCPYIPDYPCALMGLVTECDKTMGAGSVFPAGAYASNVPCKFPEGRRYLTSEDSEVAETFACAATLGVSGYGALGEAMVAALYPEINAPGGCNAGFLRKDALLMVTFIGGLDYTSEGDPAAWAGTVLGVKGDPGAVVFLEILNPDCSSPNDRICEFIKMFPHHMVGNSKTADYGPIFEEATDLVADACAEYVPG